MSNLNTFKIWLESRHKEMLMMRMKYELGDKPKDDDLYEWIFSHSAVYGEVLRQFNSIGGDKK